METESNISGISENLSESIVEQKDLAEKEFKKNILNGKRIAISVSESEDLYQLGLSDQHLKDISIEIARYLIVNGGTMLYGGDLRQGGYTDLFSELSFQYKHLGEAQVRFENYIHFLNVNNISQTDKAEMLRKQVLLKLLDVPENLRGINTEKEYKASNSVDERHIVAESFFAMRKQMAEESDARIVVGGRLKNFAGYFPGIIEEIYHTMRADKPLYLLGGFGGATKSAISVIKGDQRPELTNETQFDSDFLKEFRIKYVDKASLKIDYDFLVDFLQKNSVESISIRNGLTIEENEILFESNNIHELVFLIIKGLKNVF